MQRSWATGKAVVGKNNPHKALRNGNVRAKRQRQAMHRVWQGAQGMRKGVKSKRVVCVCNACACVRARARAWCVCASVRGKAKCACVCARVVSVVSSRVRVRVCVRKMRVRAK